MKIINCRKIQVFRMRWDIIGALPQLIQSYIAYQNVVFCKVPEF